MEANIKAEQHRGRHLGSSAARVLVFGAALAVIYFLGTSLFSAARSTALVRWVLHVLHRGGSDDLIVHYNDWLRWIAHYLQFFVLFLFLAVWPLRIRPLAAMVLCLLVAAADEGHQYFLPDRTCSLSDFELDSAGVVTAFVLAISAGRLQRRSQAAAAATAVRGEKASA